MSLDGSQQETPDGVAPSPAVVTWGDDRDEGPAAGRRPGLAAVRHDRRLVPLTVGLGALAVMLSLMSEWQVTLVRFDEGGTGDRALPARLDDLSGWAPGYLVGLLVLAATTVLMLYGPTAVRRSARLVALSSGGLLLALLAAVVSDLRAGSELNNLLELTMDANQIEVAYGRGVWCAVVGVAAVTLGAYLAGRHLAADAPADRPAPTGVPDPAGPADDAVTGPEADFSWRRPHGAPHDDGPPDAPLGLTVEPTAPFTRQVDDREPR